VSYFGRNQYIEYIAGELPIILSAPHGGSLRPAEIPDRTYGTTVTDLNTSELAQAVDSALVRLTGKHAHVVIVRLHRVKLDANRDMTEGAQGDTEAEIAWQEFQRFLADSKSAVNQRYTGGLYVDLHGHGHAVQRLELGYLLSAEDLRHPDDSLDSRPAFEVTSSIRTLSVRSPLSFSDLLRGPSSLGALLEAEGYPAVPSDATPGPGDDEYFAGGFNTALHGCRAGGVICGVQIESNRVGVRDTEENRARFAAALARVIERYLQLHVGVDITP
jgi:N-formylglutamate amidohydrolase